MLGSTLLHRNGKQAYKMAPVGSCAVLSAACNSCTTVCSLRSFGSQLQQQDCAIAGPASPVCCAHPASTATLQSAVIQDLIARHNLPSPAHPSQAIHWHSTTSHAQQHSLHTVSDTPPYQQSPVSPAMLHIELPTLTNLDDLITQRPAATGYLQSSARTSPKHLPTCPQTQQQISKLQTILATVDVAKAVAKHPLLLSYCPATLQQHMQKLEDLVGADAAASMVVKMPQLLHFKSSTLAAKLDHLYDLLPKVDVSKVGPTLCKCLFQLHILAARLFFNLLRHRVQLAVSSLNYHVHCVQLAVSSMNYHGSEQT